VSSRHREPWGRVETIGFDMASASVPWFSVKFVGLTDILKCPFKGRLIYKLIN